MLKAQTTINLSLELVPKISEVEKELNVSTSGAIEYLVKLGLEQHAKLAAHITE